MTDKVTPIGTGQWVVSLAGGSKKTLHKIGSCWRQPGIHYKRFEVVEEAELKTMGLYGRVCKDCFPSGQLSDTSDESDGLSNSDSSS